MFRKQPLFTLGHTAALIVLLALTVFPFYLTVLNSFKDRVDILKRFWGIPAQWHLDNYATAFRYLLPFLANSIFITAMIVLGVLILSSLAAYSFARFQFPFQHVLYFLILMLLMIPGFLLLVPQFILIKDMGLLNTYSGQIFPPIAIGSTMATMLIKEFFAGIPKGLFEAAQMEGAPEFNMYVRIAIPLSVPILSVVAIMNTMQGWNNYIWPLVITSGNSVKPVILALGQIPGTVSQGLGLQLAGYVIASVPLLILFAATTRTFVAGLTSGSMKG
ncbi:carbohydrate ABC transporter permease [Paenibacillus thalictri]|uniref:Carbohydrate ABC transporter permease n=1 Tax=Paenibacillus thalictri TaxID=2527873 RepID=A0A4V2J3A3_9BACL|nr:carbohydrate ABC transporter permease [Paenibacillus thalictri]TBL70822.1 carbohydrate ABC transporter permease [Paenibacillus thalictri]